EKTTTTQCNEIASLKRRVNKLEKKNRSRTYRLKRLYKVGLMAMVESSANKESLGEDASKQRRIDAIDADEEITLVSVQDEVVSNDVDKEMFDVDVLDSEEVFVVEHEVAIKRVNNEVNFIEEVVEVINTTKLIIDVAQVSVVGDKVSAASAATTVSAATTTTATITTVDDITLDQALEEIKNKEEVAIDAIPLSVKSLKIVDWKIYKEGRKSYYQIMRTDGKSQMYMVLSQRLKSFEREDLKDLYKPDIMFSVCLCARFQEAPKTSHLEAVKRILRYIKGTTHLGLWYPMGNGIETVVYADSDHAENYVD
nr:copia protein [Tanacetum cinerariifolium]